MFKMQKALTRTVKGAYCLLMYMRTEKRVKIGALGSRRFNRGCYIYVGSALAGVEQRLGRHWSRRKKLRWHIDYLLKFAEPVASIAIEARSKSAECELLRALSACQDASFPVPHFGSSDCTCPAHLLYFGDSEPEMVMETVVRTTAMLTSAYPRYACEDAQAAFGP